MTTWNIEAETGYKPLTTFWEDFSIADMFGHAAVKDTFKRAFDGWKENYQYLTELVMVLNHRLWFWYERDAELARLYEELWMRADAYACENLQGDELAYYYRITD